MGDIIRPMQLVEIDVIGMQSLQGIFASLDKMSAVVTLIVDMHAYRVVGLGCQDDLLTAMMLLQRMTNDLFAFPLPITIAGVDQIDSCIQCFQE